MAMPEPYRQADKAILSLTRTAVRKSDELKRSLTTFGFDELNVLRRVDRYYSAMNKAIRSAFKSLWIRRYIEVWLWVNKTESFPEEQEDSVEELAEIAIAKLLDEPNRNTNYAYDTEITRKRDRAREAVDSVPSKSMKLKEIDKAVRFLMQMSGWYADFTSQDAEIQAFKESGAKKLKRHEHEDAKTCAVCRKLDGEIYPIDAIPPLPHLRCRRWFTPIF